MERYLVEALRSAGYDVGYVAEFAPGMSDQEVLALAVRNEAMLITNDKDFGEIVFQQRKAPSGVLFSGSPTFARRTRPLCCIKPWRITVWNCGVPSASSARMRCAFDPPALETDISYH